MVIIGQIHILIMDLTRTDTLSRDQRREGSLLSIPPHLAHHILMVLLVQIRDLRQSDLVPRVLVFVLIQEILASSDNTNCIVPSKSQIPRDIVAANTDKVR